MMNPVLRQVLARPLLHRNLLVALVVGTVLNLINQGDAILSGGSVSLTKFALTYCVPFCVASYGSYSSLQLLAKSRQR